MQLHIDFSSCFTPLEITTLLSADIWLELDKLEISEYLKISAFVSTWQHHLHCIAKSEKTRCCPPPGQWWATWVVSMATNYFTCPLAVSNNISISIITSASIRIIVTILLTVGNNISISIITSIDIRIIMTFSLAVSNNKWISNSIKNNQILLLAPQVL